MDSSVRHILDPQGTSGTVISKLQPQIQEGHHPKSPMLNPADLVPPHSQTHISQTQDKKGSLEHVTEEARHFPWPLLACRVIVVIPPHSCLPHKQVNRFTCTAVTGCQSDCLDMHLAFQFLVLLKVWVA